MEEILLSNFLENGIDLNLCTVILYYSLGPSVKFYFPKTSQEEIIYFPHFVLSGLRGSQWLLILGSQGCRRFHLLTSFSEQRRIFTWKEHWMLSLALGRTFPRKAEVCCCFLSSLSQTCLQLGLRSAAGSLLSASRKGSTEISFQKRQKQTLANSKAWIYSHWDICVLFFFIVHTNHTSSVFVRLRFGHPLVAWISLVQLIASNTQNEAAPSSSGWAMLSIAERVTEVLVLGSVVAWEISCSSA